MRCSSCATGCAGLESGAARERPRFDLVCIDCGDSFDFPLSEQHYFTDRGLRPPKRWRDCRAEARERRESAGRSAH